MFVYSRIGFIYVNFKSLSKTTNIVQTFATTGNVNFCFSLSVEFKFEHCAEHNNILLITYGALQKLLICNSTIVLNKVMQVQIRSCNNNLKKYQICFRNETCFSCWNLHCSRYRPICSLILILLIPSHSQELRWTKKNHLFITYAN